MLWIPPELLWIPPELLWIPPELLWIATWLLWIPPELLWIPPKLLWIPPKLPWIPLNCYEFQLNCRSSLSSKVNWIAFHSLWAICNFPTLLKIAGQIPIWAQQFWPRLGKFPKWTLDALCSAQWNIFMARWSIWTITIMSRRILMVSVLSWLMMTWKVEKIAMN